MADSTNIHQAGVQINFKSWERFDLESLTNDGVVLFQYLVFHCQSNAEWTHSDNDLRAELGIKRSRITALRAKFTEMGILDTRIVKDRNDIRAYRLNFTELAKLPVLRQIYRQSSAAGDPYNLSEYAEVFKAIAANQPKLGAAAAKSKVEQAKLSEIKQLADRMKATFDSRRKDFNAEVSKSKEGRVRVGTTEFSPSHLRKLKNAVHSIGNKEFIHSAFIAYCDIVNEAGSRKSRRGNHEALLPETPRGLLNYFLSYSTGEVGGVSSFNVIYTFGEYFTAQYGHAAK